MKSGRNKQDLETTSLRVDSSLMSVQKVLRGMRSVVATFGVE